MPLTPSTRPLLFMTRFRFVGKHLQSHFEENVDLGGNLHNSEIQGPNFLLGLQMQNRLGRLHVRFTLLIRGQKHLKLFSPTRIW